MQIACLGWGSLIWNPGNLQLSSGWNSDGPNLPIEFARESADGRITLVLVDGVKHSPALWAILRATDIETAKADLAKREGISDKSIKFSIGCWESNSGTSHGKCSEEISRWALGKGLDGVVWINLKYGFRSNRDEFPTLTGVIEHLNGLSLDQKCVAEEYVRKTPVQVRTEYRIELEKKFGWFPVSDDASQNH
ncbi:hypothetical protein [Marinobacterium arenosum]|uniref:hypothetical protein n=1 Tax=Marinobacterium arenosum TaxID=2862496 RepID=UPI001C937A35|nr:hypothetical protein [Marinobacterium arenosum]MBY4677441.1 hypothetical protein [Marinobacterium arenosum]